MGSAGKRKEDRDSIPDLGFLKGAYLLSFLLYAAFILSVYSFAKYGGSWVDDLDDRIGEIVAARASALAGAGREDEALALYEEALSLRFDEKRQRVFRSVDYARLLMKTRHFDEAFAVCASLVELDEAYSRRIFRELQDSLNEEGRYEERLRHCGSWREIGLRDNRREVILQALRNEAYTSLRLRRVDKAVEAFADLFRLRPDPKDALAMAQTLIGRGCGREAIAYLEYVIENGDGENRASATELLSTL
jgi:tetratricopeptide (TPR) repeat protein